MTIFNYVYRIEMVLQVVVVTDHYAISNDKYLVNAYESNNY